MKKLKTRGPWNMDLLKEYYKHIEEIAVEELGLDTYPSQIEIITAQQMLDAYSSHAMPMMYDHWSFGKNYVKNKNAYDKGYMGLAYEIVSNTNPCIGYLMEENSIMMQVLTMAHAMKGHNFVFKNNYLFKNNTDASYIVDYLKYAKEFINNCEEKYGYEQVEMLLDVCHALQLYGVDKYKRKRKLSSFEKEQKRLENIMFLEKNYDDVIHQTLKNASDIDIPTDEIERTEDEKFEPEENILYFLEKNTPNIKRWQREIIRIVRKISQYFYPQRFCKLVHEGSATFVHYYIMNRLHEKGLVDDGFMLEFFEAHSAVLTQPDWNHPAYKFTGINVYALGFAMMQDIKRICMEPTEEDKEYFPTFAGNKDWIETFKWAATEFRDESFILQFLSPKVIRDFKMFSFEDGEFSNEVEVTAIQNKEGYYKIKENLAKMYDLNHMLPNIQVKDMNKKTRELYLVHKSEEGKSLDIKQTSKVLTYLRKLWGYSVNLYSEDKNGNIYEMFGMDDDD